MSLETLPIPKIDTPKQNHDTLPDDIVNSNTFVCEVLLTYPGANKLVDKLGEHHKDTKNHCIRTAQIATTLCEKLSITGRDMHLTVLSALLHDAGKLKVSNQLLGYKGFHTDDTKQHMRDIHTNEGPIIAAKSLLNLPVQDTKRDLISAPDIKALQLVVKNHHNKDIQDVNAQISEMFPDEEYRNVVKMALFITIVADILESCLPIGDFSSHNYGDRTKSPEVVVNEIVPFIIKDTRFCDLPAGFNFKEMLLPIVNDYVTLYSIIGSVYDNSTRSIGNIALV